MISDHHAFCRACGNTTQLDHDLIFRAVQPEAWPVCPCGDLFALPSLAEVDELNAIARERICGTAEAPR